MGAFMIGAVIKTPVTPDCRIWPIVIFSGRFIAGGRWMGKPDARAKGRARVGPAELPTGFAGL